MSSVNNLTRFNQVISFCVTQLIYIRDSDAPMSRKIEIAGLVQKYLPELRRLIIRIENEGAGHGGQPPTSA